jgi:hypothetical protein
MSQKTKERILYIIGVIFITAMCVSWKDERWSADKESLQAINKLISKEKVKMNKLQKIIEVFFIFLGWILVAPKYIIDIFKSKFKK